MIQSVTWSLIIFKIRFRTSHFWWSLWKYFENLKKYFTYQAGSLHFHISVCSTSDFHTRATSFQSPKKPSLEHKSVTSTCQGFHKSRILGAEKEWPLCGSDGCVEVTVIAIKHQWPLLRLTKKSCIWKYAFSTRIATKSKFTY